MEHSIDSNETFEHPKLTPGAEQIRLLTFLGTDNDGKLKFLLETAGLQERPFVALSYTWGRSALSESDEEKHLMDCKFHLEDVDRTVEISVNESNLLITPNLHDFLKVLSSGRLRDISLYVDQICINHCDIAEQGHQVALMGRIYSAAVEVIAWMQPIRMPSIRSLRWLEDSFNRNLLRNAVRHLNYRGNRDRGKGPDRPPKQLAEYLGGSEDDLDRWYGRSEASASNMPETVAELDALLTELRRLFLQHTGRANG